MKNRVKTEPDRIIIDTGVGSKNWIRFSVIDGRFMVAGNLHDYLPLSKPTIRALTNWLADTQIERQGRGKEKAKR